jgi:nucleotide-binding universal stress UspA family protein
VVEVTEQASSYLHQTSKKLRRQALPTVEEHVLQGHPAVAIIDYARSISDNIIAMASHVRSGMQRWLLGSITDLVARNPGDPVLVVHAHDPESAKE